MNRCPRCGLALFETPESDCPACEAMPLESPDAVANAPAAVEPFDYPVGERCLNCTSPDYREVRPDRWIAFRWDRICKGCETRYVPPTPSWAGLVFIAIGLFLAGGSAISLFFAVLGGNPFGLACNGLTGLLGLLAVIHGSRTLLFPGRV